MALLLGSKDRFAAEVGELTGHALRRVDLWAAGQWLTCDDNMAYVPQFQLAVARTAEWMRSERAEPSPFAGLSPETSHRQLLDRIGNLCGERHLRKHLEDAGRVLVAELPAEELVAILDRLVTVLGPDQSRS